MYDWRPYVPAAERRRKAEREVAKLRKKGQSLSPVRIEGRAIARTFWGKAWCDNLERYSDYENRLPRGRTYVRNGSVLDLRIAPGEVQALVSGSEVYRVTVRVEAVRKALWEDVCTDCAGAIDSLVELLQGRFSKAVMERLCRRETGLFPAPAEMEFSCTCPDWALLCKHVAAALYGIGARLDEQPQLLFALRKVDEGDLLARAGSTLPLSTKGSAPGRVLEDAGLAELFGLEFGEEEAVSGAKKAAKKPAARRGRAKAAKRESASAPERARAPAKRASVPKPKAAKKKSSPAKPKPSARPVSAAPALPPSSPVAEIYDRLLREHAVGRREKLRKQRRRR